MGTNQWNPDSATSNRSVFFRSAQPVWKKGESTALHSRVVFLARLDYAKDASLTITGCNFYRVFLNGEFVGYGPARTSHGYAEVDSYPLNLSASGQNVLEIYALAYGSDNYYAPNEPAFLQAEVVANGTVLSATGKDFLLREWNEKIQKIIRYSFQRGFAEGYDFTRDPAEWEEPEIVEGRILLPRMVSYPTYREYRATTRERGRFGYTPRPIEDDPWLCSHFFRTFPSQEYEMDAYRYGLCLTYEPNPSEKEWKGGTYSIFALEASKTGFLHLKGRAKEESEIYLYFDEIDCHFETKDRIDVNFRRSGCMNGVGLRLKTGEFDFVSFEPYSAKYVRLVVKYGHIENPEFSIQSYENPDADRFVLECDDPDIVRIAESARNNFVSNAVDILTDCPSRERAGWLCDSYFSGKAETLLTGKNLVEENFLTSLLHFKAPIPEGALPMCYPADNYDGKYIPNWCFFYIVEIADFARRNPASPLIWQSRENVAKALGMFQRFENEFGLLENLEGWVFIEWSKANDEEFLQGVNFPSNMMYAYSLWEAGCLYGVEEWKEKAQRVYDAIRRFSFQGEFFVDNAIREEGILRPTDHISEACQYYAFFTKTATKADYPELYAVLLDRFGAKRDAEKVYPQVAKSNAFIGNFLRLLSLVENGDKKAIKGECIDYFANMAKLTGTLWEMDNPYYGSLNHGFASYVANLLVDYLTGYSGKEGKVLRFSPTETQMDCHIEIPLEEGKLIIDRKNGLLSVACPEGYRITGLEK